MKKSVDNQKDSQKLLFDEIKSQKRRKQIANKVAKMKLSGLRSSSNMSFDRIADFSMYRSTGGSRMSLFSPLASSRQKPKLKISEKSESSSSDEDVQVKDEDQKQNLPAKALDKCLNIQKRNIINSQQPSIFSCLTRCNNISHQPEFKTFEQPSLSRIPSILSNKRIPLNLPQPLLWDDSVFRTPSRNISPENFDDLDEINKIQFTENPFSTTNNEKQKCQIIQLNESFVRSSPTERMQVEMRQAPLSDQKEKIQNSFEEANKLVKSQVEKFDLYEAERLFRDSDLPILSAGSKKCSEMLGEQELRNIQNCVQQFIANKKYSDLDPKDKSKILAKQIFNLQQDYHKIRGVLDEHEDILY